MCPKGMLNHLKPVQNEQKDTVRITERKTEQMKKLCGRLREKIRKYLKTRANAIHHRQQFFV